MAHVPVQRTPLVRSPAHTMERARGVMAARAYRLDGEHGRVTREVERLRMLAERVRLEYEPQSYALRTPLSVVALSTPGEPGERVVGWQVLLTDACADESGTLWRFWTVALMAAEPQRRGAGRLMLECAAAAAAAAGADFIAVSAPRPEAVDFYKSCDFRYANWRDHALPWKALYLPVARAPTKRALRAANRLRFFATPAETTTSERLVNA